MEYRIKESYAMNSDEVWFAAECKKRFLFWGYWLNITDSVWRTEELAEMEINKAKDKKTRKLKVVKEFKD